MSKSDAVNLKSAAIDIEIGDKMDGERKNKVTDRQQRRKLTQILFFSPRKGS